MKTITYILLFLITLSMVSASEHKLSPSEGTDVSVTVDNDFPSVIIVSPINANYNSANPLLINFTIIDNSPESSWYSLNGQPNITMSSPFFLNLAEGSYNIIIYAEDTLNRINYTQISFTLDNSLSFCNNLLCDISETCSTCPTDCGPCQNTQSNDGGGSGGGTISTENSNKQIEENSSNIKENLSEESKPENKIISDKETNPTNRSSFQLLTPYVTSITIIIIIVLIIFLTIKFISAKKRRKK
jgi:hypothetical protein